MKHGKDPTGSIRYCEFLN